jgi:hypothetical protein
MSKRDETIFRIRFYHEDKVYEIYARSLATESIFGFLEIEEIVFSDDSSLIVDPSEEKLKAIFQDVVCTYIPYQSVIRIDEVKHAGTAKVVDLPKGANQSVVRPFPGHSLTPPPINTAD